MSLRKYTHLDSEYIGYSGIERRIPDDGVTLCGRRNHRWVDGRMLYEVTDFVQYADCPQCYRLHVEYRFDRLGEWVRALLRDKGGE